MPKTQTPPRITTFDITTSPAGSRAKFLAEEAERLHTVHTNWLLHYARTAATK